MPEFRETTLSNGLRVAAEIDGRGYSAAFGYFVRAGSRDEVDRESGLSHFLEHMMFKGTQLRSAADVNRELDELGGQSNAYTSEEQTVYYATVLPKFQDRLINLLTDMLSPTLDENEFTTERQVILEEIAKYEDQPPFGAFERAMEVHFGPRGLGRRILGTTESIKTMEVGTMRDYYNRRYRPENIVLAATGNIDFDALVAQVDQLTQGWSQRPESATPTSDPDGSVPSGISLEPRIVTSDAQQAYLVGISPGPSSTSDDRYATRALGSIMGDEGGSRLFWELIDSGRAEVATLWPHEFMNEGAWFTYMICAPEDAKSNRRLMQEIIQNTIDNGIKAEELKQTLSKATAGAIMQSERPSNRLFGIGSRWLTCREYLSTDDALDCLRSITIEDVEKAAKKYLTTDATEIIAAAEDAPAIH
jgi:predicted Zn-dependent peptidase